MSNAGTQSNRGDAYQTLVAFGWALNIISNTSYEWLEVDSTSLDAVGLSLSVDDVVIGCKDNGMILCQCKKNPPDFNGWSVSALGSELTKAAQFLSNNINSKIIFYTRGGGFGDLAKLREYAITQPNESAYLSNMAQTNKRTNTQLEKYVPGINTYNFLQCISFEISQEIESMEELLRERLNYIASNPEAAFNALWTHLDKLGGRIGDGSKVFSPIKHKLSKLDLHNILIKAGSTLSSPVTENELKSIAASTSAIGRQWRRDIAGKRLAVPMLDEILNAIEAKERSILLTGGPGSGKTCVLLELQEHLEKRNDLISIFIQAREYEKCITPDARISQGLPEDLTGKVGRIADKQPVVVIIDSLDVLSLARDHIVLLYFLSQIDQLLLIPNVTVVAACREFDRHYDTRLAARQWNRIITSQLLDWSSVVAPLLSEHGVEPSSLDAITQKLLQNPRELTLFTDIAQRTGQGFNITTSQELNRKYLEVVVQRDPALGEPAMQAIEYIATEMLRLRRFEIPHRSINMLDDMRVRLLSAGILQQSQSGNITFAHQTLLDVLVLSNAERKNITLKKLIESLPAVPFVRPTIRAYVEYLGSGNRQDFRKQIRAVFDSDAAYHIKRLVAESFAEHAPHDDDWSLLLHLYQKQQSIFSSIYRKAHLLEWHYFWLKFFVPHIVQERNSESLGLHIWRTEIWKNEEPESVIAFWLDALSYEWADQNRTAQSIMFALQKLDSGKISAAPLIEKLLIIPKSEHDTLGYAIEQCINTGGCSDDLLWNFISGDINEESIGQYNFDNKLRCDTHDFREKDFLLNRMLKSERLLDLAIESVEKWAAIKCFDHDNDFYRGFLHRTSYGRTHSIRELHHVSAKDVLLNAIEKTILNHAKDNTAWWINNKKKLCCSKELSFRYFMILALTEVPEKNTEEIASLVCEKKMLETELHYEIGNLLNASLFYLDPIVQDEVISFILTLHEDKIQDADIRPWILVKRVELIKAIPAFIRSPDVQAILSLWEDSNGQYIRQPYIGGRSGTVAAPFSYEIFLSFSDEAIIKILQHYRNESRGGWEFENLVGGAEQVEWQLSEAASRNPSRFLKILTEFFENIPERFAHAIMRGLADYLDHRYGNLSFDPNSWQPVEEPDPELLAHAILDEIACHIHYWQSVRATAKALEACSNVVQNNSYIEQLISFAIGFFDVQQSIDSREVTSSRDLITRGINMSRGDTVEAIMIIASKLAEKGGKFPDLLIPALKSFSRNPDFALRSLILRRLAYLQSLLPELGWELFDIVMEDADEFLWELAEPCLYYEYKNNFAHISCILDRIVSTSNGVALETWGRISALATLCAYIDMQNFIAHLHSLNNINAWKGAVSVWSNIQNVEQYREQCFDGIRAGLNENTDIALVVSRNVGNLFRKEQPIISMPQDMLEIYFSIIEKSHSDDRVNLGYEFEDWLNVMSLNDPDYALIGMEKFIGFIRKKHHYSHGKNLSQCLTRLFREAEEREESDNGKMLRRVIIAQDAFLMLDRNEFQDWLGAAERP